MNKMKMFLGIGMMMSGLLLCSCNSNVDTTDTKVVTETETEVVTEASTEGVTDATTEEVTEVPEQDTETEVTTEAEENSTESTTTWVNPEDLNGNGIADRFEGSDTAGGM